MKIPFSTLAILFAAFSEDLVEHAMDHGFSMGYAENKTGSLMVKMVQLFSQ